MNKQMFSVIACHEDLVRMLLIFVILSKSGIFI